jgi:hypothetical protein
MMSISKLPSKYLKCPTCLKTPNYRRIENILSDAMMFRDNRPFDPENPIIVSETGGILFCRMLCHCSYQGGRTIMTTEEVETRRLNFQEV